MSHSLIHQIWVGPHLPPFSKMATWIRMNPEWKHRLWGNECLHTRKWRLSVAIEEYTRMGYWFGVADVMRLELLQEFGGLYLDADFECDRSVNDLPAEFLVMENEIARPGVICNGVFRLKPFSPFVALCIEKVERLTRADYSIYEVWRMTGPGLFTSVYQSMAEDYTLPILPARSFLPVHFTGELAPGDFEPYARHEWSSTAGLLKKVTPHE